MTTSPLSSAQERLWIQHEIDEGIDPYSIVTVVRLIGPLDVERLERAFADLVRRHDALRSHVVVDEDRPTMQIADPDVAADEFRLLRTDDVQGVMRRRFQLDEAPLLRVALEEVGPEEHLLGIAVHHIVADAWSLGILAAELSARYAGEALPPLATTYAAWSTDQRAQPHDPASDPDLAYWKSVLADRSVVELPSDRPRPPLRSHRGDAVAFSVPTDLVGRLRRTGFTPFMTLLSALSLVHARWSGCADIPVAAPIAGRDRVEVEGVVGCFVNTIVLCVDLSGDPTVEELQRRVRRTCLEALDHGRIPFEQVVAAVAPPRSLSSLPFAQVALVVQNAPEGRLRLGGVGVEVVPVGTGTSKFELSVSVSELGGCWQGVVEYDTDLFDRSTIERFARDLIGVLEQFGGDRDVRCSEIVVGAAEIAARTSREHLVVEDRCVHELFEGQVDRTPHAIALRHRDSSITYRDLDDRANALARHLISSGAGPGTLVAVRLERGIDLVVALLAVLKAGAGYLPLDPDHPHERATTILRDANCTLTIDRSVPLDGLPPAPRPTNRARPTDIAYVIYTSGSTGTPKGVVIEHRNVANLLRWADHHLGDATSATWSAFHSFSFDYSVWETFVPLTHGGTTVIVPDDVRDPATFVELLANEHIAVVSLTPSGFRMLTADPDPWHTHPHQLRTIVFGGEALETHHIPTWFPTTTDAALINMFGITEVTVHATASPVHPGLQPSLGHPIANTQLHLLDGHLTPVPDGTIGEIHIAGAGLARGYLNQPALTAERFTPNPFGPGRLYRTGDLARYRDGHLEYVGRRDRQVKLRGYRIELGEIEHAIGDAHVTIHDGQIIAYTPTPTNLHHLRTLLPDHMVPTAAITIDHWPLTPNGKIDHAALPHPTTTHAPTRPPTELESDLGEIIAGVLGVDRVGPDDDFFALGGDSITAIHVVSRSRRMGLGLSARDVFEAPTPAGLAGRAARLGPGAVAAGPGPVSLTPIQAWFFGLDVPEPNHWNQSVTVEATEVLDPDRANRALQQLVERHDALRLRFLGHEQSLHATGPEVALQVVEPDQLESAIAAAQTSLDLAAGRVIAAVCCRDRLVLVAHHLVVDALSWGILVEDLQSFYDGTPLPPTTLPFATWARQHASEPVTPQPNHHGTLHTIFRVSDDANVHPDDLIEVLAEVLAEPFDVEHHGRDADLDLTRTVGWFTTISRGAGDPEQPAAVVLNDAGRELPPADGAWRIASTGPLGNRAPANGRPYEVEIVAGRRADGSMVLRLDHLRDPDAMDDLAAVLAGLVERRDGGRYRPRDFPAAGVTGEELDRAVERLLGAG